MGLHKPFDRHFITIGGQVMTEGSSLGLTRGVVGLFEAEKATKDGLPSVQSLEGKGRDTKYVLKMGNSYDNVTRSYSNKSQSSIPFRLDQVVAVRASAPDSDEMTVDEVTLGYNGVDEKTGIKFSKGDRKAIFIELCGDYISYLGYPGGKVTVEYVMEADKCNPFEECIDCDNCDTVNCAPIILNAIEFLQDFELRGGVKMSEAVEITPVKSCDTAPTVVETPWDFYQMSVSDMGDNVALAMVKAQYPGKRVIRKNRDGITSTYEIVAPQGTVLPTYKQSISSLLKDCEDCPSGYTEVEGGVLYAITLEDNGVDETATVQGVTGAVAGSAIKYGQVNGVGYYSVLFTEEPDFASLLAEMTELAATITKVGETASICTNGTITQAAWAVTGTCTVSEESYKITVPDNNCGQSRLEELQGYYPDNEVFTSGTFETVVALSGTSGTATLLGETLTFNTDLATTASDFVTASAASILTATGLTVTASGDTIVATGELKDKIAISVSSPSANLAGVATTIDTPVAGGCQTEYVTTQITNMVCNECDDIYKDFYRSEAPAPFEGAEWTKVDTSGQYTNCICGIRFKGKKMELHPDDVFLDHFEHLESSVQIQVSGGYITEQREGVGRIIDEPMAVTYLSRFKPRTHVGGNMRDLERKANWYFNLEERSEDLVKRRLVGGETVLDSNTQYADFVIEVRDQGYSQSMGSSGLNTTIAYHILAPFGKHQKVQDLVNLIAGGAGLSAVAV